jgi:GT2 family glycosyltransferase
MTPSLDIVIVNFNTSRDLTACLASVFASPPAGLRDVFVVDNASTDSSVADVRARWPTARVLALDRNVGFGAANNIAMRESQAELILLLNSDTLVPAQAVDRLVARLVATGAAAAGPKLVDGDGKPEASFGSMLGPWTELRQMMRGRRAANTSARTQRAIADLLSTERTVDWVSGACLLVRRDAALAAGLFDERYFLYEEDVDFCAALRARGHRVLFTPAAQITHLRGRSPVTSPAAQGAYDRSHVAFYEKHRPAWAPVLKLWLRLRGRPVR